jgi:hypothetical protein
MILDVGQRHRRTYAFPAKKCCFSAMLRADTLTMQWALCSVY